MASFLVIFTTFGHNFTDFSPERNELVARFLTILTNLRPESSQVYLSSFGWHR